MNQVEILNIDTLDKLQGDSLNNKRWGAHITY